MATATPWSEVKDVFSQALALPAAARDDLVARACAGRPEVAEAVHELLAAHDEVSASFLEPGSLALRPSWTFRVGDRVAERFRIVRPIARGAMGEVYEVFDERLQMPVALKAIRPELLADPQAIERVRREVRVTRDIAHDGVCRVFDLVEHRVAGTAEQPDAITLPCLTMQLLQGESLDDWIRQRRPVPVDEALPLVRQIADALHTLHQAGIVHRDLKPSNVMLVSGTNGVRAVLTDFGLARPLQEGIFETQGAALGGAPFFMAPELFRGERPSIASDVYALGLLVDEMVTERRAFVADSLHGLLLEKLQHQPVPPNERATGLPVPWVHAIVRSLSPAPADRFPTAKGFAQALEGAATRAHAPLRRAVLAPLGAAVVTMSALNAGDLPPTHGLVPSLLVVPFSDQTNDPAHGYIARGTSDEVARRLGRLKGWLVHVPSDPDAEADVEPRSRATFALRGTVERAGEGFRISAEIADVARQRSVWARTYEGGRQDVLAIEDRLASEVLEALSQEAGRRRGGDLIERARRWLVGDVLPPQGTSVPEAYDAYLRARSLSEQRTLESALAAAELYRRAAEIDPAFAAPHAGLADVQRILMDLNHAPHGQLLEQAEHHTLQALALDPDLPGAIVSLAAIRQAQSRWDEAEDAYRRALDLHPKFALAHRWYGGMLLQFDRVEEAFARFERALELDPYDIPSQSAFGLTLFFGKRPEEAARHLEGLLARRDHEPARFILGQVYASLGVASRPDHDQWTQAALAQAAALRTRDTEASHRFADLVCALAWSYRERPDLARPFLDVLLDGWRDRRTSPSFAARVLAVQGQTDAALEALEAAEREGDRVLMYLRVSPHFDRIRHHERFVAMMRRLALVP